MGSIDLGCNFFLPHFATRRGAYELNFIRFRSAASEDSEKYMEQFLALKIMPRKSPTTFEQIRHRRASRPDYVTRSLSRFCSRH